MSYLDPCQAISQVYASLRYMSKLQSAMPKSNISKHLLGHRQDPLRSETKEEEIRWRQPKKGLGDVLWKMEWDEPKENAWKIPKVWENDCFTLQL